MYALSKRYLFFYIKAILLLACCIGVNGIFAQKIEVYDSTDAPFSTENLIENIFLQDGVIVTDIIFEGNEEAVGYFQDGTGDINLERGIVLTTGKVKTQNATIGVNAASSELSNIDNGSDAMDSNISALATQPIHNLAKYTIKFIPKSDTLRFNYVFASEEYPEYTCQAFNDLFGFFISGPNPNGGTYDNENIALIPNSTLPVSINNVHNGNPNSGTCNPINQQYYNDNTASNNLVFNAYLDAFVAEAIVIPCAEYTIKLVIADQGDPQYDSAVFLGAKSFGTQELDVKMVTVSIDGTIVEDCSDGELTFSLPYPTSSNYVVDYNIIGDAVNGVDYNTIPSSITIPAGSVSASISISAIEDNIGESIESIGIDIVHSTCSRDTTWAYIRDKQIISPNLQDTITICNGEAALLDATLDISTTPPTTFTNDTDQIIHPVNNAIYSNIEVMGVQPFLLSPESLQSICIDSLSHPWIDDLDIFVISPDGTFIELTTDNGGNGGNNVGTDYYLHTCFTPTATQAIDYNNPNGAPPNAVPFTGEFVPEGYFSDLWDQNSPTNGTWQLVLIDDTNTAIGTLHSWSITFNATYELSYEWTPSTALSCTDCPNPTANPTSTTTYYIDVMDSYGCMVKDTIVVEVMEGLDNPIISCDNSLQGEITFGWDEIDQATAYEVNINGQGWTTPNSDNNTHLVENLAMDELVTIEVRALGDCGNAEASMSCNALNCVPPVASIDMLQNVSCQGAADGSATLSTMGNPNVSYAIMGVDTVTNGVFENLADGMYNVTIDDGMGCPSFLDFTIEAPEALISNEIITPELACAGDQDGTATVSVSGGTYPYAFKWNTASNDSILNNLAAGEYYVTVTDLNNCAVFDTISITAPDSISLMMAVTHIDCTENTTGNIIVTPTGGTGDYTYNWSNNETSDTLYNLIPDDYFLTVTDENNCIYHDTVTIVKPPTIQSTTSSTPSTCFNTLDGSASVSIMSSQPGIDYNFLWSNDSTTTSINNLIPNIYYVSITDSGGCIHIDSVLVEAPPAIELVLEAMDVSCIGDTNGTASVVGSGGTGTLTYLWDTGISNDSIDNLGAAIYTVIATDDNNCQNTASVEVNNPSAITVEIMTMEIDCNDDNSGAIDINVSGGTPNYTYEWSNMQTTQDIDNLSVGTYSVTISDDNACSITQTLELEPAVIIQSNYITNDVTCYGEASGSISSDIQGGMSPYQYQWSTGASSETIGFLLADTYYLTITDANNCEKIDTLLVNGPDDFITGSASVNDVRCNGEDSGAILVDVTGGTAPYSYSLNGEAFVEYHQFSNLNAGDYFIFIKDANECIASFPVTVMIEEPAAVEVDLGEPIHIHLGEEISLNAIVENVVGTPNYYWIMEDTTGFSCMNCPNPILTGTSTNEYSLIVQDENGCWGEDQVMIFVGRPKEILVPTGFTPNADGVNDILHVHGKSSPVERVSNFQIYDRWGNKVYENSNFNINDPVGWDGRFRGEIAPAGVYMWYVEVQYIDGTFEGFKGETTLIR